MLRSRCFLFTAMMLFSACSVYAAETGSKVTWSTSPSYITDNSLITSTAFHMDTGTLYDESNAVIIDEGAYHGSYRDISTEGRRSEDAVRKRLEKSGFRVFIWRDLTGAQMETVLDQVTRKLGHIPNSRFFFYYYGHGDTITDANDKKQGYLVPIDAPDSTSNEQGFIDTAFPITRLIQYSSEMSVKHAFFALEACDAGSIFDALGSKIRPPRPNAYVTNDVNSTNPGRQFLTAGTDSQEVPAGGNFTALLLAALSGEQHSQDGFVTGLDLIAYVTREAPSYSNSDYPLNPQSRQFGIGDIILGSAPRPPMATPATVAATAPQNTHIVEDFAGQARFIHQIVWPLGFQRGETSNIQLTVDDSQVRLYAVLDLGAAGQRRFEGRFSTSYGGFYIPVQVPASYSGRRVNVAIYAQALHGVSEQKVLHSILVTDGERQ